MRVKLQNLLSERQVCHPTRLMAISAAKGELRIIFHGYVWWKDNVNDEGQITFIFTRPNSGALNADIFSECGDGEADEILEDFLISTTESGGLSDYPILTLYGSSPIPAPQALYLKLDDYLRKLYTYKRPSDFLNGDGATGFAQISQSSAYLIARGPGAVCDIIVRELDEQGVNYYYGEKTATRRNGVLVHWLGSVFECEGAFAEFN
ncbi:hypothetical protein [Asticcacaulis sp.]|uniref:hypothetical protein n=1 Tax=Asticcacaulis sp. TaxID=1872648 RepID=UPI002BF94553|nr:hypothetical protein [Asticcacaulis sp.]HTM80328.1 hypothetical protein [Asticcacaulis sp.]